VSLPPSTGILFAAAFVSFQRSPTADGYSTPHPTRETVAEAAGEQPADPFV